MREYEFVPASANTREMAQQLAEERARLTGESQTIWLGGPGRYIIDTYKPDDERHTASFLVRVAPEPE